MIGKHFGKVRQPAAIDIGIQPLDQAVPDRAGRAARAREVRPQAAFFLASSKNCSSSVEPLSAVVDEWPPSIACVTASK